MAKMTVYHGGYQPVKKPEIRKGRNTKDFGYGFYCTIIKEQAQRWAKRYETKVISIYDVRMNNNLNIKEFTEMSEEWLDFIVDCRSGKDHNYDIVMIILMELLQKNSSGFLQNSNIQLIKLHFVRKMH